MLKIKKYYFLLLIILCPLVTSAAEMDVVLKYAWGDKLGWVNFNPDGGTVSVYNTSLNGYAWSANYGWINLNPTSSGVKNDGQGNLSGSAWSENLGWLDFGGVKIIDGLFSGQATGSEAGNLNFSCDNCAVKTNWRAAGSNISSSAVTPVFPQSAAINTPVISTINLQTDISLSGNSDVKGISYSLTNDFSNSSILPFDKNFKINICPTNNCAPGNYEVWLKFFSSTGHSLPAQKVIINYQGTPVNDCASGRVQFLEIEKNRFSKTNLVLSHRLSGRILLQTEDLGRAWYVYPKTLERHYLGCPQDAFKIMRELSLGISNNNFDNLTSAKKKSLAGLILLKVEDSGRAYYVNPVDLQLYYLGRPDDARLIMRNLALGITNKNLSQIKIKE